MNFLTKQFAEEKVKYSNRDIALNSLNYDYSESDLECDEILEIANDTVVNSNIDIISKNIMNYEQKWNYNDISEVVVEFTKDMFKENSSKSIDWNKYSLQISSELLKFGFIDHLIMWNEKEREILKLKPLNQSLYSWDNTGEIATYNSSFEVVNLPNTIPDFIQCRYKEDSRNIHGKTSFNREMLNLVRFKKRLIILMDLAADKCSIPPVIGTVKDEFARQFDISTEEGRKQYFAYLDGLSSQLAGLSSGNGIITAALEKIEGLKNNISPDLFVKLKDIANETLAIGVLGTAMTTQQGSKGSYSSNNIADKSIVEPKKQDMAKIVQKKINEIVRIAIVAKFGKDTPAPEFEFDFTPPSTNEEIKGWYDSGEKVKSEYAPEFIFLEDGQEFIQKSTPQPLGFSEKKKTLKSLI